jgi:hypothetical protein
LLVLLMLQSTLPSQLAQLPVLLISSMLLVRQQKLQLTQLLT